jgi:hypothetical protein
VQTPPLTSCLQMLQCSLGMKPRSHHLRSPDLLLGLSWLKRKIGSSTWHNLVLWLAYDPAQAISCFPMVLERLHVFARRMKLISRFRKTIERSSGNDADPAAQPERNQNRPRQKEPHASREASNTDARHPGSKVARKWLSLKSKFTSRAPDKSDVCPAKQFL